MGTRKIARGETGIKTFWLADFLRSKKGGHFYWVFIWNEKWSFPLFFNWQNLIYTFTEIEIQIMDEDFVIPLCKDDLLSSEEGSYVVDEVLSVRVLPNKLRGRFYCSWRNICRFFLRFSVYVVMLTNFQNACLIFDLVYPLPSSKTLTACSVFWGKITSSLLFI